jgi:hypothetical protein
MFFDITKRPKMPSIENFPEGDRARVLTDRLRDLADSLDCLTEQDFMMLTETTPGTLQAWRKRGKGPDYILAGNRYLYPRQAVAAFLVSSTRQRTSTLGKDLL